MCKVSDSTKPDSGSCCTGENTNVGDDSKIFANINAANRKVRTIDTLRKYGIRIEKDPQRTIWSHNIRCPLPSHKNGNERTSSFGYCFVSDHWICLGCHKAGRSVEFISLYTQVSRSNVAEEILARHADDTDLDLDNDYIDDISSILFDGSKYIQLLIQKYKHDPNKLKEIDKLIWWLDFYLMTKSSSNNIIPEELKSRIDRMKELIV
jgi:hypothetical protein